MGDGVSSTPRTDAPDQIAETVLNVIRTRRVVRRFTAEPVDDAAIRKVVEAGRWATAGGNRRIHRFLVVRDPAMIRLVKAISPGMLGAPPALIVICLDIEAAAQQQVPIERHGSTAIDVGTAAMNMMVAAHALGLGSWPGTTSSPPGMSVLLELSGRAVPQLLLLLGHPAPHKRVLRPGAKTRVTVEDLTYWERYGRATP
jgi:nitroreductase